MVRTKTVRHAKKEKFRILLFSETDTEYRRRLLQGFYNYCNMQTRWEVHLYRPSELSDIFELIKKWNPHGLFFHRPTVNELQKLATLNFPVVVHVTLKKEDSRNISHIIPDNCDIGVLAADYFMEQGFDSFAFFGYDISSRLEIEWSAIRCDRFCQTLQPKGWNAFVYEQPYTDALRLGQEQLQQIADWLTTLPRPLALFACNDRRAADVLEACRMANLQVPEDVAVLGVDNSESICNFSTPPLSSIPWNTERAGFEAAELLDKLVTGQTAEPKSIILHPRDVVERQSTNILRIKDKDVAEALRYIRSNADKILQVSDVYEAVSVPRRTLARKFTKTLGRTIHDEIRRSHIKHIANLLTETDISILLIASHLGYTTESNMSRFFREMTGFTPHDYRKRFRQK